LTRCEGGEKCFHTSIRTFHQNNASIGSDNDRPPDGPRSQTPHRHRQCPLYLQSWLFFTPKECKGGVCGMDLWCPLLRTPLPLNDAGHFCGFVEALHYCFLRLTYRNPARSYAQYFCCRVGGRGIYFSNVIS
jgi:hypothetical protein